MINFLEVEDFAAILGVLYFVRELIKIVCFIIPMGLIVMITIDIGKVVITGQDKESKTISLIVKRVIYAVVIFLLPQTVFGISNILIGAETQESGSLWKYLGETSVEDVRKLVENEQEALRNELKQMEAESAQKAKERANANDNYKKTVLQLSDKEKKGSSEGTVIGQTYNLTDEELRGIARLCQQEQGSPEGAAAEASLMANRYELFPKGLKNRNYTSLFDYVENDGWWASSSKYMNNTSGLNQEVLDAVKEVLVVGKRTLPLYVDEHDYMGDIKTVSNNGTSFDKKDRSQYKQDVTYIENTLSSEYTFYSFPTETSDPFGYTESAMKKYKELQE